MTPYSSTLAWKIPWREEPGGLQSMGWLRVGHNWATSLSLFTFMHWRRRWQPTPVFLPGESQGRGEPGGQPSLGSNRVGHDWSDFAAVSQLRTKVWGLIRKGQEKTFWGVSNLSWHLWYRSISCVTTHCILHLLLVYFILYRFHLNRKNKQYWTWITVNHLRIVCWCLKSILNWQKKRWLMKKNG